MSLSLQFLPARQGDAMWIRWGDGHQMLIDMGTEETGRAIAARIEQLDPNRRTFELLVVTHVDRDHIGGVLTGLADLPAPPPGLTFRDVWFNGWEHLHGQVIPETTAGLEGMGPAQGERLTTWLRHQPWNDAFGRGPVVINDQAPTVLTLPDDLTLTVLGPTQARLRDLQQTWQDEVEAALAKGQLDSASPGLTPAPATPSGRLESLGPSTPPLLTSTVDLDILAETPFTQDPSKSNGTSITLLLEWKGRRILLTGDAFASDLAARLEAIGAGTPVTFDLIKVPHHGSRNNVSRELIQAVDCAYWMFCTDGTRFRHPDAVAIARILRWTRHPNPTLGFNVPSKYNLWWNNDDWRDLFTYRVQYGEPNDGLTLSFDPR